MPTSDSDVLSYWRRTSDIDYLTQFIKAWISFNALMRVRNPSVKKDRELLESLKNNGENIVRHFSSKIQETSPQAQIFRDYLGQLQYWLEMADVVAEPGDEPISFRRIRLDEVSKEPRTVTISGVECKVLKRDEKIISQVEKGSERLYLLTQDKYDIDAFKSHVQYNLLTVKRREALESCYKDFDPNKISSLIVSSGGIDASGFRFDNENNRLYKGTLEILYSLRCALFHGRVVPKGNEEKVYEYAYYILRSILDAQ